MTDKRRTVLRLMIYLLIAFGIPFAMIFLYVGHYGWTMENDWYGVICSAAMLCPAAANILTRLITGEGLSELQLKLRHGHTLSCLITALVFPLVSGVIIAVLSAVLLLPPDGLSNMVNDCDYGKLMIWGLYAESMGIVQLTFGFGEEFGWRGYLMPKLEKLMPLPAALVLGGVIWGLWHAPLVVCGHNFGTEYSGYPWVGIGAMCLSCIGMGVYLTAITKATGSAVTAGLAHIAINSVTAIVTQMLLLAAGHPAEEMMTSFSFYLIFFAVNTVMGLIVGIVILIKLKQQKKGDGSTPSPDLFNAAPDFQTAR